jgi:recombination protein RecA
LGQGREAVKDLLKDNIELAEEVEAKIVEAVKEKIK